MCQVTDRLMDGICEFGKSDITGKKEKKRILWIT